MSASNLLASEASPYLRQHAHDPVWWQPWGDAAFARAKAEQKPVLLSIGYASCHWCHVMQRESFQDPDVAAFMNKKFVSVKVDREERPDVDAVYMAAVQALTGQGGWPLTVALTPDGEPFHGGTYFPAQDRIGMPSFTRVLAAIVEAWEERRQRVEHSASELAAGLRDMELPPGGQGVVVRGRQDELTHRLEAREDPVNGGFGGAPKFPPHETIRMLLAQPTAGSLALAMRTLDAMQRGGLKDQLGGGFARYSVDAAWRVPHFEMMLYDNAAMLRNYATAYHLTGETWAREVAHGVAGWLMRELAFDPDADPDASGGTESHASPRQIGFYCALDADQQGEEGAYYVWSQEEFRRTAAEDADLAAAHYGVVPGGPFEGKNVLYEAADEQALSARFRLEPEKVHTRLERVRQRLLAVRGGRPKPHVDDKALASWNGLALGALASAGRQLVDPELLEHARATARYLRARHWHDGRLWHMWRQGQRSVEGLLEDYAYVGLGLLELYRATLEGEHLAWALELARHVAERFHDPAGGYFITAADMQRLIVRPKGYPDAATPGENAAAAELVWWAARYQDDEALAAQANQALQGIAPTALQAPQVFASTLRVLLQQERPEREVVLAGVPGSAALDELLARWRRYDDGTALVLLVGDEGEWPAELPLAEGRTLDPGAAVPAAQATGYVCESGACRLPAPDPEAFERALLEAGFAPLNAAPHH